MKIKCILVFFLMGSVQSAMAQSNIGEASANPKEEVVKVSLFGLDIGSSISKNSYKLKNSLKMSDLKQNYSCEHFIRNSAIINKDYNLDYTLKDSFSKNFKKIDTTVGGRLAGGWYLAEVLGKKTPVCLVYFDDRLFSAFTNSNVSDIVNIITTKYSAYVSSYFNTGGPLAVKTWRVNGITIISKEINMGMGVSRFLSYQDEKILEEYGDAAVKPYISYVKSEVKGIEKF